MKTASRLTAPPAILQHDDSLQLKDVGHSRASAAPLALALVRELCQGLDREGIHYCHWKSNNALDRSASGDNDLDLLISRGDADRFTGLLHRLRFKRVEAPEDKRAPGVLDYFGYDEQARRLVHVHAHYQLSLGDDLTKNYRLPLEQAYLESAVPSGLFKVPAPEFEFIVFVVRMVLKHGSPDATLFGKGRMKASEQRELTWLLERVDLQRVHDLLRQHLPYVGAVLFSDCVQSLRASSSVKSRLAAGLRLQRALRADASRPMVSDTLSKVWRRVTLALRRRVFRSVPRYRLQNGGVMAALVGGDGAGKSTALEAVYETFSGTFDVIRVHMGRPAWSPLTIGIRTVLKAGQLLGLYPVESSFRETIRQESPVSPGYPWLVREVCTARDRYHNYERARRHAAGGGIVLFDRFPVRQVRLMDGPQSERFVDELTSGPKPNGLLRPRRGAWLTEFLIKLEQGYYRRVHSPELLVVLKVHPRVAVQRKTEENPASVLERSTEIWEADWEDTPAVVVDASKPRDEVASNIASLIWAQL